MTAIVYDDFHKPGGYTLADYDAQWSINMLGEMAVEDTRQFDNHSLAISATPFRTGNDSGVADHGKYLACRVSVPMQERLYGQGVKATFANVVVTIEDNRTALNQ